MHTFTPGDQVKFRHNSVPFAVLAEPEPGKLTISAVFGIAVSALCLFVTLVLSPAN